MIEDGNIYYWHKIYAFIDVNLQTNYIIVHFAPILALTRRA